MLEVSAVFMRGRLEKVDRKMLPGRFLTGGAFTILSPRSLDRFTDRRMYDLAICVQCEGALARSNSMSMESKL